MTQTIVIIGANLAGAAAAITLRDEGFTGNVVLIGAEPHPPYERTALSKKYLQGEQPLEKLLVRPAAYYDQPWQRFALDHAADRGADRSGSTSPGR